MNIYLSAKVLCGGREDRISLKIGNKLFSNETVCDVINSDGVIVVCCFARLIVSLQSYYYEEVSVRKSGCNGLQLMPY